MAQSFHDWLVGQLDKKEWKQADLVRASNGALKIATVSKWMRGASKPEDHGLITTLARTLRLSVEEVQRAIREEEASPIPRRSQEDIIAELETYAAVPVPMITDLVAHMGSGGGFVDDYVYLPPDYRRGRKKTIIGIYAKGDCMMPEIRDGDAVIFDREEPWEPDDVVIATVGGNAVVRRLAEVGGRMVLRADADGETHALTDEDAIVGKVIWVMHRMVKINGKNGGSNGRH